MVRATLYTIHEMSWSHGIVILLFADQFVRKNMIWNLLVFFSLLVPLDFKFHQ